ncbi:hypothetical protein NDU88_004093 [Pleurodeles waltl]|uniref:Uncharacterized protein n=1 Tax=Pleurodeles waltl TaxID=8319 RepID=A0AAV7WU38_PLEWA|nr:hypothetical protein NDU88_004093 [Pleurodeles waltl]
MHTSSPRVSKFVLLLKSQAASPTLPYRIGPPLGHKRHTSQPVPCMEVCSLPVRAAPQLIQPLQAAPPLPSHSGFNASHQTPTPDRPLELTGRPSQGPQQAHECEHNPAPGRTNTAIAVEPHSQQHQQVRNTSTVGPTAHPFTPPDGMATRLLPPPVAWSLSARTLAAPDPGVRMPKTSPEGVDKVRAPYSAMGGEPMIVDTPGSVQD